MECEEEELEPWQQKSKPIVVDDDDDDDEPIFVGEILSSKPANACKMVPSSTWRECVCGMIPEWVKNWLGKGGHASGSRFLPERVCVL